MIDQLIGFPTDIKSRVTHLLSLVHFLPHVIVAVAHTERNGTFLQSLATQCVHMQYNHGKIETPPLLSLLIFLNLAHVKKQDVETDKLKNYKSLDLWVSFLRV